MTYERVDQKKARLDRQCVLPDALVSNLDAWFRVELTYTSNALEGNTLSRRDTAVVLEHGLTIGGKSLREHLEATTHAKALDLVRELAQKINAHVSVQDIMAIHETILRGIDDTHAGRYRNVAVRISGSSVILPNPRKVPALMDEFEAWLKRQHALHPVAFAAEAHYRLVTIHPFVDGNGRCARLLMNLLLMKHGYPPAIIRKRDRLAYVSALEKAQLGGAILDYERMIVRAVERSLDIYLHAAQGRTSQGDLDTERLLKIGQLAQAAQLSVPTIRHWTKEGLLEVAEQTPSGYQLYAPDMIARCNRIRELKATRLTIAEIKKALE